MKLKTNLSLWLSLLVIVLLVTVYIFKKKDILVTLESVDFFFAKEKTKDQNGIELEKIEQLNTDSTLYFVFYAGLKSDEVPGNLPGHTRLSRDSIVGIEFSLADSTGRLVILDSNLHKPDTVCFFSNLVELDCRHNSLAQFAGTYNQNELNKEDYYAEDYGSAGVCYEFSLPENILPDHSYLFKLTIKLQSGRIIRAEKRFFVKL